MNPFPQIQIDDISIKVVVSSDLIESFDCELKVADTGPGLHFHSRMDEIFYIHSGRVRITLGEEEIIVTPGMVVRAPKMTPHAWKAHEGPARLLITFIPGGQQVDYLRALGDLSRSGASWEEGIAVLQKKFDNTPL